MGYFAREVTEEAGGLVTWCASALSRERSFAVVKRRRSGKEWKVEE